MELDDFFEILKAVNNLLYIMRMLKDFIIRKTQQ